MTWLCIYVLFLLFWNKEIDKGNQLDWSLSKMFIFVANIKLTWNWQQSFHSSPVLQKFLKWGIQIRSSNISLNLQYFSFCMYLKKNALWIFSDFIFKFNSAIIPLFCQHLLFLFSFFLLPFIAFTHVLLHFLTFWMKEEISKQIFPSYTVVWLYTSALTKPLLITSFKGFLDRHLKRQMMAK